MFVITEVLHHGSFAATTHTTVETLSPADVQQAMTASPYSYSPDIERLAAIAAKLAAGHEASHGWSFFTAAEVPTEEPAETAEEAEPLPLFASDNEWREYLGAYVTAYEAVGFDPPCSFGVSPIVSREVMAAIVAAQAMTVWRYGTENADAMSWEINDRPTYRGMMLPNAYVCVMRDGEVPIFLHPDEDDRFHLVNLGWCWSTLNEEDLVIDEIRTAAHGKA